MPLPPLHILVTGGAGFIGSHLVDALLAAGHTVRVFDNLEPQVHGGLREQGRWPDYCNPGAEYILGDVRDREALRQALDGVDMIFHQAAAVGVGQSMYEIERYVDANTRGTAVLLDLLANDPAIRGRVRKLVVASSMSIYGEGKYECPVHGVVYPKLRPNEQLAARDWEMRCPVPVAGSRLRPEAQPEGLKVAGSNLQPATCNLQLRSLPADEDKPLFPTSIYAITKKDQEEMCLAVGRAYGIPTVALRYFNVYGPRQALSNPYTGVAAIFSSRLLNNHPPLIFEDGLQSRDFVHVSDIVQANLLAMHSDAADYDYLNVGTGHPVTVRGVADVLSRALDKAIEPVPVGKFREGDIRHCVADISKAQRVLGYTPCVSFEDGMRELAAWVRVQAAEDRVEVAARELEKRGLVQ
jgi:dTDP-L-rhamnose 4-epimerase